MDGIFLARHPTPEDHNKAVKMDLGSAETDRDRGSARSLATPAPLIDVGSDGSPAMTMSSDTPVSAPLPTPPDELTDVNHTKIQFPGPLRLGTPISGNGHISYRSPVSVIRPHTNSFELDATVTSKTVANGDFSSHHPGSYLQRSFEKSCDPRKGPGDGTSSRSTACPKPVKDVGTTPATAIHHTKASEATKKKGKSTDEESGSDPFLGTGKPVELLPSINSATTRATTTDLASPSPARIHGSQLGEVPGLLNLHDAHEEVLLLLNKLKAKHRTHTKNEVDAALKRCQDDLRARSRDKTIGIAEANILDREAARIGRARGEATSQAPIADKSSTGEDAAFQNALRLALAKLLQDARAALDAVAQTKSQSASPSLATKTYMPYRVEDESRVTVLKSENRTLKEQMEHIQAETSDLQKKLRAEILDLQKTQERLTTEANAYRRDMYPTESGHWGKEWNGDSRRGG